MEHKNITDTTQSNYTYILECSDGTLYTGWTTDIDKRLLCHNSGQGAKYTRTRLPVKLLYYEVFSTKKEAMSREYHIKKMSRTEKLALIKSHDSKQNKHQKSAL